MSSRVRGLKAQMDLLRIAHHVIGNSLDDEPYAGSAAACEYSMEQLALVARELTRATDALPPDQQPVGWRPKPSYRGVPIPETLLPNLGEPEHHWWKCGVDSAREGAALQSLKIGDRIQVISGPYQVEVTVYGISLDGPKLTTIYARSAE